MTETTKKGRWWVIGWAALLLLGGAVLLFMQTSACDPFVISVMRGTTNEFGERVVVGVSNRSRSVCCPT